jgi:hypothetical protein
MASLRTRVVKKDAVQGMCMPTHVRILTGGANGRRLASEDNNEKFTLTMPTDASVSHEIAIFPLAARQTLR